MLSHAPELLPPGVTPDEVVRQHDSRTPLRQWKQTFFQQHNPREPIIQIPKVDTTNSALIVKFAVDVKRLIGRNLQLPHPLARDRAILDGRIEFIAPR